MSVFCNLCSPPSRHEDAELAEHMWVEHGFDLPAALRDAPTWPDGGLVIVDKSLEPADFADPESSA